MKINKSRGLSIMTAAILLLNLVGHAQSSRPNFDRPRTYDVQNYIIRVSFDAAAKKVFGDTTVQFKPLAAGFRELTLDAVGMQFQSVKLDPAGTDLKYQNTGDKVIVTLDKDYSPSDLVSVRLKYTTTHPKKGVYFVQALKEQGANFDAQIW